MADLDSQVLSITRDIKTQVTPFYKKLDDSSNLLAEMNRRYNSFLLLARVAVKVAVRVAVRVVARVVARVAVRVAVRVVASYSSGPRGLSDGLYVKRQYLQH